jgi:hypothetical protein
MLRVCQPRREPGQEPIWICRPWPGCVAMRKHRQTDEPLASRLNIAGSGSAACCVLQCWLHPHAGLAAVLQDSQLLSLKTKNIPFLGCNCQTVELTSLERKEASAAPWKQGASGHQLHLPRAWPCRSAPSLACRKESGRLIKPGKDQAALGEGIVLSQSRRCERVLPTRTE